MLSHERIVRYGREQLDLTTREFDILERLATHPGWVYSVAQLADGAERTEDETDFSPDSVSAHVSHLRRKLAAAGAPELLDTVRGVGYRLRVPEAEGGAGAPEAAVAGPDADGAAEPGGDDAPGPGVRTLRDSLWTLIEAVQQVERAGTDEQVRTAHAVLDDARHELYRVLADEEDAGR